MMDCKQHKHSEAAPQLPLTHWVGLFKMCQPSAVNIAEHIRQDKLLDSLGADDTLDYSQMTYSNAKLYGILPVFLWECPKAGHPIPFVGLEPDTLERAERIPQLLRNYLIHAWKQDPTSDECKMYKSARNLARLFITGGTDCPKALRVWEGKLTHMPVYPTAPPAVADHMLATIVLLYFPSASATKTEGD